MKKVFKQQPVCLLFLGVLEEQATERRGHPEVQTEKDGDIPDPKQKDQERTAKSKPPNGIFTSEDTRKWEMTPPQNWMPVEDFT